MRFYIESADFANFCTRGRRFSKEKHYWSFFKSRHFRKIMIIAWPLGKYYNFYNLNYFVANAVENF